MLESTKKSTRPILRFWRWIKVQVIQEVPSENAVCEYDCKILECAEDKWENCENRLRKPGDLRTPTPEKSPSP
jgi:hypothetical protein